MSVSDRLAFREASERNIEYFHHLLLRADSRLPDELVVAARTWLADGLVVDVAEAIVFTALSSDVPLAAADAELLGETLRDAGVDTAGMAQLKRSDVEEMPPYRLAPVDPAALAQLGPLSPHTIDLTATQFGPGGPDPVDGVAIAAIAELPRTQALWRSWQYPAPQSEWALARRAYLIQMPNECEGTTLATTAARMQTRLVAAGETDPLVRVFTDDLTLPRYHRMALRFSALLWTAEPRPAIQMAKIAPQSIGQIGWIPPFSTSRSAPTCWRISPPARRC
jgi:hypothetical protein